MPNWCSTTVMFYSKDKSRVERANRRMNEYLNAHLADAAPFTGQPMLYMMMELIPNLDESKVGRSFVNWMEEEVEERGAYWGFQMDLQDAWGPYPEELDIIADFFGIEYVYYTEEPGQLVYINSDTNGLFYTWNYILDCEFEHNYYDTEEELVKDFNKYFCAKCKTFEDCQNYDTSLISDDWCVVERFMPE